MKIEVAGEELVLLPQRAALWQRERTLLVADAHWGKAATFRAFGVPVPRGTTLEGLQRLDAMIEQHAPRRILFLGDLLHARQGRVPATLQTVRAWREQHAGIEMTLVRGNHDRGAGDPPDELRIHCVDEPLAEAPFAFCHHPRTSVSGFVVAGHIHPAVTLRGRAEQRERLPCFLVRPDLMILPAFGSFTGHGDVVPARGDAVYVIADGEVLNVNSR